jgi:hypothetical protein
MELNALAALDRTALLIGQDLLGGRVSKEIIVQGLSGTTAQIVAPAEQVATPAGQTVVVTLALHLAMCGISIDLQVADADLEAPQPPLAGTALREALANHIAATWPWIDLRERPHPDVRFIIGSTTSNTPTDIVVSGGTEHVAVGPAAQVQGGAWTGTWPIAPIAAGTAAASLAVRSAVHQIALAAGGSDGLVLPASQVIDLTIPRRHGPVAIGDVPMISAGAITNGLLFALLRVPGIRGLLEVFDDDRLEITNLNRYVLARADQLGELKALGLGTYSNSDLTILPHPERYTPGASAGARRILVGADDIEVRWAAQHDVDEWLGIGATSHLFSEVTTHATGGPCAGCVHRAVDAVPEMIPTISVISGWAGLLLANELLQCVAGDTRSRLLSSWPLGLGGPNSHSEAHTSFSPRCALACREAQQTA